jgi:hypothetical protein
MRGRTKDRKRETVYDRQVRHKDEIDERGEREERKREKEDEIQTHSMAVKSKDELTPWEFFHFSKCTASITPLSLLYTLLLPRHIQQHVAIAAGNISNVGIASQRLHDGLAGFDLSQRHKCIPCLLESLRDSQRCLCLSFSSDNCGLSFLVRLFRKSGQ